MWFPIKIEMLRTTTLGSQSRLNGWEPHIVAPNLLIIVHIPPTQNPDWELSIVKNWDKITKFLNIKDTGCPTKHWPILFFEFLSFLGV